MNTKLLSLPKGFHVGAALLVAVLAFAPTAQAARPPRAAGVVVKDEGDGGATVATFLAERKFI